MCKINCNGRCPKCAPDEHNEIDKTVVAQEPVAEVFVNHRYVGFGRVERCNDIKWLKEAPPVGTKLYANAAPCARCKELERKYTESVRGFKRDLQDKLNAQRKKNVRLQSKITEQAAEIQKLIDLLEAAYIELEGEDY